MSTKKIKKLLVANRGEIAIRVIRAARDLGIPTVAVYSDIDRTALHVRMADEAYHIGPTESAQSYLRADKLIDVMKKSGANAVHPGYGFLSERTHFSRAVIDAGYIWVGPPPDAIDAMGSKTAARQQATKGGVPVVPGDKEPIRDATDARKTAKTVGYPIMVKAVNGGGGKGMRVVRSDAELDGALALAQNEAQAFFGDSSVYIEKYIENPRHIEIQIIFDEHGNGVHLFERECSLQRRHQKVVEECPSPFVRPDVAAKMGEDALKAGRAVGYTNAGTVEFIMDANQNYYFLEMNTRIQVEHPVTEMVTGVDLVKTQLLVAQGEKLPFRQSDIVKRGHAIECRICAEDPANNYMPSPGLITHLQNPEGPGVRVDSGVYEGWEVPMSYDPMIAKLITWGSDRREATQRMRRALLEYKIGGITTNIPFHLALLEHPDFGTAAFDTHWLDNKFKFQAQPAPSDEMPLALAAAALARKDSAVPAAQPDGGSSGSMWKIVGREAQLRRL
ncbi:MAG: acetyl-CoA carboxylase biotin carboxylase subunit [Deltaproteobacteria bacterium]|nr:acetyl-CoA carboxylase biotin carboxylase subunit [Deltaproteobacteria bacterium]